MFYVMRKPTLMEDEGCVAFVQEYVSREEAQSFIDNQEGEFFRSNDYFIIRRPER